MHIWDHPTFVECQTSMIDVNNLERMSNILEITDSYELRKIYDQDEIGLMYRMGQNRT